MSGRTDVFRAQTLRLLLFTLALLLPLCLVAGLFQKTAPAQAQGQDTSASSKEVQGLLDNLDDIDTMHALGPLKLTPDQADQLSAEIAAARADYEKKVMDLGAPPLLKMADEIRTVRKQVIAGSPIPKDFDDRVKKVQKDFTTKRDDLNAQNIRRMSAACHNILSAKQIATATQLEKDAFQKLNRSSTGASDAQMFNQYVVDVFISNPRIGPLLKEMKAGLSGNNGNTGPNP